MAITRLLAFFFAPLLLALCAAGARASEEAGFRLPLDPQMVKSSRVQIVFLGGPDCPACRAWMAQQWPLWQGMPEAAVIDFQFIQKPLTTRLSALTTWPESISVPLREQMTAASAQRLGSPQLALVVNGQLIDYFFGAPSAEHLRQMVRGVRGDALYPRRPCLQLGPKFNDECAKDGPAFQER